jgi:gamma-glutamylaminecyclotransferase
MCVIIIKKEGLRLPKNVAKTSSVMNPHGLGIMWLDTFKPTFHRSNEYKILNTDRPFIAHFRYATVGAVGKHNTHPFQCGPNKAEWLMMNGTIRGLGDDKTCDSRVLAENIGYKPRHMWADELSKHQCRFVTINTTKRSYEVYNKSLWTIKDEIWYSKDNVLDEELVAVYGTLKMGYSNYWHYLSSSRYVDSGRTLNKYPLIIKGLPYLLDDVSKGHNVEVDIFAVSESTLEKLDRLEGHPNWYRRKKIPIRVGHRILSCWIYFNMSEKATPDTVMHKRYTQDKSRYTKWDWEYYTKPVEKAEVKVDKDFVAPQETAFYDVFDPMDEMVDEFDVKNEKPICINCYNDLEHDMFANYHCVSCGGWFTETEVKGFRP